METLNKKNVTILISIIGLILILSLILYLVSYRPSIDLRNTNADKDNQQDQKEEVNNTNSNEINTVPVKLPYGQAVNVYIGKRMQFDPNCTATPSYQVFKKGDVIMLDNRSSSDKKISLNGKSYNIKAYDYTLTTLTTTAQLPYTILIDCDGKQNVATINLQK